MIFPVILAGLMVLLTGINATSTFVDTLPRCWQRCIDENKEASCESAKCICKYSLQGDFLPNTVACARSDCDVEEWAVDVLLIPLQAYCRSIGKRIPSSIISSAQCEATQTSSPPSNSIRTTYTHSSKGQKTESENEQTSTAYTTTVTKTTTDDDGATLVFVVPVEVQPSTTISGSTSVSTVKATGSPVSTSVSSKQTSSPSPTLTTSSSRPATTPARQVETSSSTTSPSRPQRTSNSNGSPFDNMQAGAGRLSLPGGLLGMGLIAGMFYGQ